MFLSWATLPWQQVPFWRPLWPGCRLAVTSGGGRYVDNRPQAALGIFGLLEIGTGLSGITFPWLLTFIAPIETRFYQPGSNYFFQILPRFFLCSAVMFGPIFFMGGTFAVLGRHLIRTRQEFGRATSIIYGINTTGAFFGVFPAGFILVSRFGHSGSGLKNAGIFVNGSRFTVFPRSSFKISLQPFQMFSRTHRCGRSAGPIACCLLHRNRSA